MYNRYLAAAEQTAPETSEPPQNSTFSGLGRTLNARLQGVRLDMDTMIALLIVWFLLMDDDGAVDWEQFLLTAALLLFGLGVHEKTAAPKFMQQFLFIMLNNGKWRIEDGE